MATLIKTNGEMEELIPAKGKKKLTLEQLQKAVGGYIEIIETPGGRLLIMNEHGKFKHLQINEVATRIGRSCGILPNDYIAGDAVWLKPSEMED